MSLDKETGVPGYIGRWFRQLRPQSFAKAVARPEQAAVFCADMTVAFCRKGNLASERVGALAGPVAGLFQCAHSHGIRHFVLLQDAHSPSTPEFASFPPHAVWGTDESDTIPELKELPFFGSFTIIPKNSLNPAIDTGFDSWLERNPRVETAIVVGNCTDLCVYQLAMYLRLRANALDLQGFRVIVPSNEVDTYDLSEAQAETSGAMPHPGDFYHQVFLYHMALNGIEVVRDITSGSSRVQICLISSESLQRRNL